MKTDERLDRLRGMLADLPCGPEWRFARAMVEELERIDANLREVRARFGLEVPRDE